MDHATPDCLTCGACCRGAHQIVRVGDDEPLAAARPDLLKRANARLQVLWINPCAALAVTDAPEGKRYRCSVYEIRPQGCRDYQVGGRQCLAARARAAVQRQEYAAAAAAR